MYHIFKKNYNLIIKNFIPMYSRREQHCSSHIVVLYRLHVIRVELSRTEKQPRVNSAVPKRLNVYIAVNFNYITLKFNYVTLN